jgi:hypothetical protein
MPMSNDKIPVVFFICPEAFANKGFNHQLHIGLLAEIK